MHKFIFHACNHVFLGASLMVAALLCMYVAIIMSNHISQVCFSSHFGEVYRYLIIKYIINLHNRVWTCCVH